MRISSQNTPRLDNLPIENQIEAQLMVREQNQQKIEGEAALQLIDSAGAGVNNPLTEGPVGRRINIRI